MLKRTKRGAKSTSLQKPRLSLEPLEPRLLLTTIQVDPLMGSSSFIYRRGDVAGPFQGDMIRLDIRNTVTGVGKIEMVGVRPPTLDEVDPLLNPDYEPEMVDIPGLLNGVPVADGIAGYDCSVTVGGVGYDNVLALATNEAGEFYAVANGQQSGAGCPRYSPYVISRLFTIDSVTGAGTNVGFLNDDAEPTLGLDGVTTLAFDGNGTLWGVGNIVDKLPAEDITYVLPDGSSVTVHLDNAPPPPDLAGQYLVTIYTGTDFVNVVDEGNGLTLDSITAIAANASGQYYGIDGANGDLVAINPLTGEASVIAPLSVAYTNINALDFDGAGTLHGIGTNPGGEIHLFTLDPADGTLTEGPAMDTDITYAFAPPVTYTMTDFTGLTFSPAGQAYTIGVDTGGLEFLLFLNLNNGNITSVRIPTSPTDTYNGTLADFCTSDPSQNQWRGNVITGVTGIEFDANGVLYALARGQLYTVDPGNADAWPHGNAGMANLVGLTSSAAATGYLWSVNSQPSPDRLVQLDPRVEAPVHREFGYSSMQGGGSISAMAFAPDGTLYAVNGTQLATINGNAVNNIAPLVDVSTGTALAFTGIGFDDDGTMYGVVGGQLYQISPYEDDLNRAACTLTGFADAQPNQALDLTAMSYDPRQPDYLWSIHNAGAADQLVRLIRKPPRPMDPFVIHIAEADEYTEIFMSVVNDGGTRVINGYSDLSLWNSADNPFLGVIGSTQVYAPGGSGDVLIGAVPVLNTTVAFLDPHPYPTSYPYQDQPYRFMPVISEWPDPEVDPTALGIMYQYPIMTGPLGTFPGGDVYAGINVAEPLDMSQWVEIVGDRPWTNTERILALAADSTGAFYGIDDSTDQLVQLDPVTGAAIESWDLADGYINIHALDFNAADDLWGVGVDSDGVLRVLEIEIPAAPGGLAQVTDGAEIVDIFGFAAIQHISTVAFDSTGNLYGVDADTDELLQIDTFTGEAFSLGSLIDDYMGHPVTGIDGIDFLPGDVLYGIGDGVLYSLDPDGGGFFGTDVICTPLMRTWLGREFSLAFDPTDPTAIWTVNSPGGPDQLVRLDLTFLVDPADNTLGYDDVYTVAADSHGTLYAVGEGIDITAIGVDPAWTGFEDIAALATDSFGVVYGADNDTDQLVLIDTATGVANTRGTFTDWWTLVDYTDVHALDFDGADTLWGIGQDPSGNLTLLEIWTFDGSVTPVVAIDPATITDISAMAFDSNGTLFAVNADNDTLVTIDTGTGLVTVIGPVVDLASGNPVTGITDIDFGTGDVLLAVVNGSIRAVNATTAESSEVWDTGIATLTGISFDPRRPGYLWASDGAAGNDRLINIASGQLVTIDPDTGIASPRGFLVDLDGGLYSNIHALDFDHNDELWAVGENALGDVMLLKINANGGVVTPWVALASVPPGTVLDITTIAWSPDRILYGVNATTDALVTINPVNGEVTEIATLMDPDTFLTITGMTGLDWGVQGVLYGVADGVVYSIDPATAECAQVWDTNLAGLSALAFDPTRPSHLWSIDSTTDPGADRLVLIRTTFDRNKGDVGHLMIGGTLGGRLNAPNSVEVVQLGFLFGSLDVGADLRTVYIQTDAGARPAAGTYYVPDNSTINAQGTINDINVRGTMYSSVAVGGFAGIPDPAFDPVDWNNHQVEPLLEHEGRLIEVLGTNSAYPIPTRWWELIPWPYVGPFFVGYNLDGIPETLDYNGVYPILIPTTGFETVRNDTLDTAQYLSSETGDIVVWGYLDSPTLGEVTDYYCLPLEAGQTIRVHGYYDQITDPREGGPFFPQLNVFGPDGEFLATFGHETVEDQGFGSRGSVQETLVFTAPEAGLYYVEVRPETGIPGSGIPAGRDLYTLFIEGATPSTLGGMRINGDYLPLFTPYGPEQQDIYIYEGNLGAVNIGGQALGSFGAFYEREGQFFTASGPFVNVERGSLVDFQAAQVGHTPVPDPNGVGISPVSLQASGNIGAVRSGQSIFGIIEAGADTGHTRDTNAHLQNMTSTLGINAVFNSATNATSYSSGYIGATGSIGRIYTGLDLSGMTMIQANSDSTGLASNIDMIEVDGDWGSVVSGRPSLLHGPDGNVRFVHIGGDIYEDYGGWIGPLNPTVLQGTQGTFDDDGGGVLTINPDTEWIDMGATHPVTGEPILTEISTTITYYIIDVDDAVGGVMTRLEVDGAAALYATKRAGSGRVEIGDFFLNGTTEDAEITISGGDKTAVDIYYVHGGPIDSLSNSTAGDIVSGNIAGVRSVTTGGHIGWADPSTGTQIPGAEAAPATTVPGSFGWYKNRMNGLVLSGLQTSDGQGGTELAITSIRAGGSIQDLYLSGAGLNIRSVVANADGDTPQDGWDGVHGVVYVAGAGARLGYIDVGDGLADDGSGPLAQAAIFSESEIGTVRIHRRYEFINGEYRGLINGFIGALDQVGNITGTDGARLTAIVAGNPLSNFRVWSGPSLSTGWLGTISFSGDGAAIYDAEMTGTYINAVKTSVNSDGIWGCYISGDEAQPSSATIGLVEAGGPGLRTTVIGATGGWIGRIRGVGPEGDLMENYVESTDSLTEFSGRHIYGNYVAIPNEIGKIEADGNLNANFFDTGGVGKFTVDGDVLGNVIQIAGPLLSAKVGGEFSSELILQGPQVAYLKSLVVTGPIGGTIVSAGKIGLIESKTGSITADISTTPAALNGDIDRIEAALAFTGNLSVSGNLGRLETNGSVGRNPEEVPDYTPTVVNVTGDVGLLDLQMLRGGPQVHLYSDLNVGGDVQKLVIEGGLFGDLTVNGNVEDLYIDANVGADFNLRLNLDDIGVMLATDLSALAVSSTGQFFAVDNATNELITIDPETGAKTVVAVLGPVYTDIHALDFGADDVLWGVGNGLGGLSLITIDPATAAVTDFGQVGGGAVADISSIAFDRAGTLFAVNADDNTLVTIDPANPAVLTLIDTLTRDTNGQTITGMAGVDFDENGILYGIAQGILYWIDPATAVGRAYRDSEVAGMTALAFDPTRPDHIWSVAADNGDAVLYCMDLPVTRGNIQVRGYVDTLRIAPGSDIVGDFVAAGDITRISLRDGDILGNVVSLFGNIPYIDVNGGSILGNVSANGTIGRIRVRDGSIGNAVFPVNITAQYGGIERIEVTNGNIFTTAGANIPAVDAVNGIAALGGPIERINVVNGSIEGDPIAAATYVDYVGVRGGDLDVDVYAGTTIDTLAVKDGDLTGFVNAETGIDTIKLASNLDGAIIRSGGPIDTIQADNITNTLISSATDIEKIVGKGNLTGSRVWAGYDVGADGLFGTADDNPLTSADPGNLPGTPHSGDIKTASISGDMINSEFGAGVVPIGGTVLNAVAPAAGMSAFGKLSVKGDVAGASGVVADFEIDRVPNDPDLTTLILDTGNPGYNPGAAIDIWRDNFGGADVTVKLSGPGTFNFTPGATGVIHLDGATEKSTLSITSARNAPVANAFEILGGDDDALKALITGRGIIIGDIALDGSAGTVKLYNIANAAVMTFGGDVKSFMSYSNAAVNPTVAAGEVGRFLTAGPFAAGALTVDALGSLTTQGNLEADVRTLIGGLGKLDVKGGNVVADIVSRGPVKSVKARDVRGLGGAILGDLTVEHGDLDIVDARSHVAANITVPLGGIKKVNIRDGHFRNIAEPADLNAIRTLTGLTSFTQKGGEFGGMLYTLGEIRKFSTTGGQMIGRVFAMDGILSFTADELMNSVVASGTDMKKATIHGDVTYSYILVGFDPGDDGYDGADRNQDDVWPDGITIAGTVPADAVRGGTLYRLDIDGDLIWSAVSAGVTPGEDGFVGNDDDRLAGTGYIEKATIRGRVVGTPFDFESYGFAAATEMGIVTVGGQPLGQTQNVGNVEKTDAVGPPHVTGVDLLEDRLVITFDQNIDLSTIHTDWFGGGPSTLELIVSEDRIFDAGDTSIHDGVAHIITYNKTQRQLTLALRNNTWGGLDAGTNFLLTLDGSVVADPTGELLDGEYLYSLPSGDGNPGGDFIYRLHFGDQGDDADSALDLLDPNDFLDVEDNDVPLLIPNVASSWPGAIEFRGFIGDNPDLTGPLVAEDVDVYRLDANMGDILYVRIPDPNAPEFDDFDFTVQVWTEDGLVEEFEDSLTGWGFYTEADTTYWISVCTGYLFQLGDMPNGFGTGSYQLIVHLFNDSNSNFGFADVIGTDPWTGIEEIDSLATDAQGNHFAVDNTTQHLVQIDPVTGEALDIGDTGYYIQALDFHSDGTLWAAGSVNPVENTDPEIWFLGVGHGFGAPDIASLYDALTSTPSWQQTTVHARFANDLPPDLVLNELDWLAANAQPGDLAIFAYVGYGDNTTLDVDGDELPPDAFTLEDEAIGDWWTGWVTDDEIAERLAALDPAVDLVSIVDADYSGGFVGGQNDLSSLPNIFFMGSDEEDSFGWVWPGQFANELQAGITGTWPADTNFDDQVTLDEWFAYAESQLFWSVPMSFDSGTLGDLVIAERNPAAPAGISLLTIDTGTGAATVQVPSTGLRNVSAIAFDENDVLYATNADVNRLVTIDTTTGAVTDVALFTDAVNVGVPFEDVFTGLTFVDDVLYGTTSDGFYEVSPLTGDAQPAVGTPALFDLTALSRDPAEPNVLYAINSPLGSDQLVRINLGFDDIFDSSQSPTVLEFVGGVAEPEDVDLAGNDVQIITAPDDVDIYSLGTLAEGTPIDVTLLTRTIGSHTLGQTVEAAIFNSNRDLIVSLYLPPYPPIGGTLPDSAYLDEPILSAYAPADDAYYVAVWGGSLVAKDAYLPYDLTVEVGTPIIPVPVPPRQTVYVNFSGGNAEYLLGEYGPDTDTYLAPFDAETFGFYGPGDTQAMRDMILAKVNDIYVGYANVQFTQLRPLVGDYSTVICTSDVAPLIGDLGIAEKIDPLNSDPNDIGVTFGGEYATLLNLHVDFGYTMDDITTALANNVAHELGHLLGLNHQVDNDWFDPPYLIMAYGLEAEHQEFGRERLSEFLIGYQDDATLLRVIS